MNFNPSLNNLNLVRVQTLKKKENDEKTEKIVEEKDATNISKTPVLVEANSLEILASINQGSIPVISMSNQKKVSYEQLVHLWEANH